MYTTHLIIATAPHRYSRSKTLHGVNWMQHFNSLRPRLNRRPFADDIFKCIFLNENEWILPRISLEFIPKVWINNIPALVQIMAWRRPGDKPLSEPITVSLLMHICVTWLQSVNHGQIGGKMRDYKYNFNTLRTRQNCHNFTDDIFKCIFLNENVWFENIIFSEVYS